LDEEHKELIAEMIKKMKELDERSLHVEVTNLICLYPNVFQTFSYDKIKLNLNRLTK